jgi:hypothetical protein
MTMEEKKEKVTYSCALTSMIKRVMLTSVLKAMVNKVFNAFTL